MRCVLPALLLVLAATVTFLTRRPPSLWIGFIDPLHTASRRHHEQARLVVRRARRNSRKFRQDESTRNYIGRTRYAEDGEMYLEDDDIEGDVPDVDVDVDDNGEGDTYSQVELSDVILDEWDRNRMVRDILVQHQDKKLEGKDEVTFRDFFKLLEIMGMSRQEFVDIFTTDPEEFLRDDEQFDENTDDDFELESDLMGGTRSPGSRESAR